MAEPLWWMLLTVIQRVTYSQIKHPSRRLCRNDTNHGTQKAENVNKLIFEFQVSIGSAAEGLLHVGDRIHAINHRDASKLTHLEAQNIFKKAGTSCQLAVSR